MIQDKIALIGHGAIAAYVAQSLADAITCCIARPGRADAARTTLGPLTIIETTDALPKSITLAIDCAGHNGLRTHGPAILKRGIDLISVSNGAMADAALVTDLEEAAKTGDATLRLLSGAIGGMDALAAAQIGGLESVTYTGRKPPAGWTGTPAETVLNLADLTEPAVHFEGSAREAALAYPKNANVAATVALAGIGMEGTRVKLIADPTMTANRHEIEAVGRFGRFRFEIEGNSLPTNPKSSALTAMSIVHAVHARSMAVGLG